MCKEAAQLGISILALLGDGDARLCKIQYGIFLHIPTSLNWLTKIEFPIVLGLSCDSKDGIPIPCRIYYMTSKSSEIIVNI